MFATQVLPEDLSEVVDKEDDIEETVGFILVNDRRYEIKKGETKIGRDPTLCSIIIENFTVSKLHAVIESEGIDDTFIYDNESTNQTKLGKKTLKPHYRYKLENGSNITFGNITAKFVLPSEIKENSDIVFENFKPPHGLDDIFDVATQVTVPQLCNSGKILCIEDERTHFQVPEKPKEPLRSVKVSEPQSKDIISRRELHNTSNDSSGIFSLSTQCQIIQSCSSKEDKPQVSSENNINEVDPVKALLYDGQDDILCTFMSLHSPVASKEIKTEIQEDDTQLFDVQTQIQSVTVQSRESIEETVQIKANSSHLVNSVPEKLNSKDINEERSPLEECINTLQNESVVPEESNTDFETTVDLSAAEESSQNDDLISTQKFILSPKTTISADPENDSYENFTETQIFEKEQNGFPFVVSETPERDSEPQMNTDFTQRDVEEDFITTQTFCELTDDRNADFEHSERDDDEDFIATQPLDFRQSDTEKNKLLQNPSRESSPDLLDSENYLKTSGKSSLDTTDTLFLNSTNNVNILQTKSADIIDSSGEETESDLEIILDKSENSKKILKVEQFSDAESEQPENNTTHEDNHSNSSYIFQLETNDESTATEQNIIREIADESDSDATDCEDIQKELPVKITADETNITTNDGCKDDKNSPTFELENDCLSQLSLEMPNTQEMENTVNKILREEMHSNPETEDDYRTPLKKSKTEVKIDTFGSIDSPLKRQGNNDSEMEAVPPKKSKIDTSDRKLRSSEKQFQKLWQVHDIEHIQPYRTRSSLKNVVAGDNSNRISLGSTNKFENSRRESRTKRKSSAKPNSDITAYLCKRVENGRKKENSPKENRECRVLRSSGRNSGNVLQWSGRQSSSRSTRNSRFRKEEYLSNPCVVFTGFDCESLEKIISDLGGKKANDISSGDVVVADKVRRTVKFLSAIALSLPVTSPEWLLACRAEKKFLDPWDFILKDEESERKWGFELKAALGRSKNAKLMRGLSVYATPNAKPPVKDLLAIVKYCGGTPLFEPPNIWPKKTIIVSCPEDEKWWPLAKYRNVKIVHYEWFLIGVLRQKLDYKTYKLR